MKLSPLRSKTAQAAWWLSYGSYGRLRCEVIIAATASMFEIFCTTTTHFIFEDNTFKSFPNERWQKWTNSSRTKGLAGH